MTTCLLIRHGQSQANIDGVLAGHLDSPLTPTGIDQASRLAQTLADLPIGRIVTSPLGRCRATADAIAAAHGEVGEPIVEPRFAEVRYGGWTGRSLRDLAKDPLWATIQATPSAVTFPADPDHQHESMAGVDERAWAAWQQWEATVATESGERALWVVVSHGDVIKALLARALGLGLDAFQSIVVDPASVSIVHRHGDRTAVSGVNLRDDVYTRLAAAAREPQSEAAEQEAAITGAAPSVGVVGGGDA